MQSLPPESLTSSACYTAKLTVGYYKDPRANCEYLSLLYKVTTGDLTKATGDEAYYSADALYLPLPYHLAQVANGSTCPNIIGPCDKLTAGQYVCANNPGGPGAADPAAITGTTALIIMSGLNFNPTAASQPTQPGIVD
ncbi:hypothetical protein VTI74DRAFT_2222 [Chaetomium olivicolor]